jgi:hypothetical protein
MSWIHALQSESDHAVRIKNNLEYFSQYLQIRPKVGPLTTLVLNPAQLELHRIIEEQRIRTGRVRIICLKARQLGCSTYVGARFFHKTIHSPGARTFIIAHEKAASRNLYEIVRRFYDNLPADLRPSVGISNAEELRFDRIDSGYIVSVATTEGAGRSATAQMLHASEVAFWPDLETQMAAILQTIPDAAGTEVVLESTANGFNSFHSLWQKAEAGESEFLKVFLPWSIEPAYRLKVDSDFELTSDEKKLMELHRLDVEQIAWRRLKISQLGDAARFCVEYPLDPSEAFLSPDFNSFISPESVIRARREVIEPYGDLIIGVDPAGLGGAATAIAWRRGHCITKVEKYRGLDTMQTCGLIARIIREDQPKKLNIDIGGLGVGIFDRLREQGLDRDCLLNGVNFGGRPVEPPRLDEVGNPSGGGAANRRAEMFLNLRKSLEGRLQLPNSDSLQAALTSIGFKYQSDGKLLLESKIEMRRRGMPSPDEADATALCFSEPDGSPIVRSSNFYKPIEYPKRGIV